VPYTTLISTAALGRELSSAIVVVDCRYDLADESWGLAQYRSGHIPGAVYASLGHDLAGKRTGTNGRHPIPEIDQLEATFSRLGIGPGIQVVAYDQDSGMYAARLWWMLRYAGHDAVAVLDGGWAKWMREQQPTRSGEEQNAPGAFQATPRAGWRLSVAEVERIVRDRSALLVDARAPERYEGQSEPIDRVPGHIPGARNLHYRDNLAADGTMLPTAALATRIEPLMRGRRAEDIVMYCGSGVTACQNLLALEHAGVSGARIYPGSWSEWSSDPSRPVETGPEPEDA
jgi:thiosulfate/3-mercaptopyruvate sulfurtransferase